MLADRFAWSIVALLGLLGLPVHASGCARAQTSAVSTRPAPAGPDAVDYRFAFDESLNLLDAEVCFRGAPPPELVGGMRDAAAHLHGAWLGGEAGDRPLPIREGRIQLQAVPRDGCVHYRVDLTSAAASGWGIDAVRRGNAIASNIALWLWRPVHYAQLRAVTARFDVPQGMRVLVPWPQRDGTYALDTSAFAFYGFAAFGRFEVERVESASTVLEVAVLDGLSETTRAHVVPWLSAAARIAALPFGRFPREHGTVVVVPAASDEPVRFGMTARGGGASLLLVVSPDAERDALERDWVAVHEFCHFLHPFVEREDAWLSEGLATYYQEVARVRAGVLPESEAWRRIYEGALLGREAQGSLAEESARMYGAGTYARVYWAGASFALLADVELRRRTGGKSSLDDVVRELSRCCAQSTRPTPASEVIAEMDRIAGAPIFSDLMRRWVLGSRLPELSELYSRLGVTLGEGGVRYADRAEDAWIRAAIMARR